MKNGDIIDGIVDVAVKEGCNEPKGDLKSPKFSFFISSFISAFHKEPSELVERN